MTIVNVAFAAAVTVTVGVQFNVILVFELTGAVVPFTEGLVQPVVVLRHLAYTVIGEVV